MKDGQILDSRRKFLSIWDDPGKPASIRKRSLASPSTVLIAPQKQEYLRIRGDWISYLYDGIKP
jgi:hypothetical protein